jgi:hypothetical protein
MGYVPMGPPPAPRRPAVIYPPISVADETTFDLWMQLPSYDHRTLEEFAENPGPIRPPEPPNRGAPYIMESSRYIPVDTGYLRATDSTGAK